MSHLILDFRLGAYKKTNKQENPNQTKPKKTQQHKPQRFSVLSFQPKYAIHARESKDIQHSLARLHSKAKSNCHTMILSWSLLQSQGSFVIIFSCPAAFTKLINTSIDPFLNCWKNLLTWKFHSAPTGPVAVRGGEPPGQPRQFREGSQAAPQLGSCSAIQGHGTAGTKNPTILLTFYSPGELRGGVTGTDTQRLEAQRLHILTMSAASVQSGNSPAPQI